LARGTRPILSELAMTQTPAGLISVGMYTQHSRAGLFSAVPSGLDLERMVLIQTLPGWEPSARRLVDILIAGSSSTPKRLSTPLRTRQKIANPGALALKAQTE
jgi:hypothetical protein